MRVYFAQFIASAATNFHTPTIPIGDCDSNTFCLIELQILLMRQS